MQLTHDSATAALSLSTRSKSLRCTQSSPVRSKPPSSDFPRIRRQPAGKSAATRDGSAVEVTDGTTLQQHRFPFALSPPLSALAAGNALLGNKWQRPRTTS